MGDRKYRQRGYMEDDRDRQPRPSGSRPDGGRAEPRPRGERPEGPRTYNMPGFRQVVRCSRCGNEIDGGVLFDSRCSRCGVDLHTCAQCGSFSPASRFECMQPIAARIAPKDTRNTCTWFSAKTTVERETHSQAAHSARKAFDDLFK